MTPEDMKRARDAIRATELDCYNWPDDTLDEIITAVVFSKPAEPVDDQFNGWDEMTEAEKLDIAEARAKVAELRPPPAPGLSAVSVARAFEVMLPVSDGDLTLTRNPHSGLSTAVAWLKHEKVMGEDITPVSPVELQKMETTNELWLLDWRDPANGCRYRLAAATLPALAMWLQDNGLAFGS